MISLGRGFYEFSFSSDDDVRTILAMGTVNLKPGLLCLSQWSKDFNKYSQRLTHAQVWIRLLDLPQEYWLERTLLEIAGAIGTPLIIDTATQKRTFGRYARVLVDIDFFCRLFYEIMVEREDFAFPIEVEYEWLPDFCSHCQILRHSVANCRWLHPKTDLNLDRDNTKKVQDKEKKVVTQQKAQTKKWQARENPLGIGSSLVFEKLVVNSEVTATVVALEQSPK
jgi:hypothetical protein